MKRPGIMRNFAVGALTWMPMLGHRVPRSKFIAGSSKILSGIHAIGVVILVKFIIHQ